MVKGVFTYFFEIKKLFKVHLNVNAEKYYQQ